MGAEVPFCLPRHVQAPIWEVSPNTSSPLQLPDGKLTQTSLVSFCSRKTFFWSDVPDPAHSSLSSWLPTSMTEVIMRQRGGINCDWQTRQSLQRNTHPSPTSNQTHIHSALERCRPEFDSPRLVTSLRNGCVGGRGWVGRGPCVRDMVGMDSYQASMSLCALLYSNKGDAITTSSLEGKMCGADM